MKLRIPLYFFFSCLITIFSDKFLIDWIHSHYIKSIIYGLLIGFSFFLIEKSGAAIKQVSIFIGILLILISFALIIISNHFLD